jgi:iron only hydrogenase large subunit-like protein
MNNEPVAWIAVGDNTSVFFDLDCALAIDDNPTPLYAHPVKEQDTDCQYCKQGCIRCDARKQLTDEEIEEVIKTSTIKISGLEAYDYCYPQNYRLDEKLFARAILRKAQEK